MRTIRNAAIAGVSMLAFAMPAFAQSADAADEGISGSEIIVQARRKDESLQDVPLVVQAVTGQDIQKLELRQFEDITKAVPGLQLQANSNGLGTTASLRGVNFDANASGAATTVEFYRNDAVTTSGALFAALYDIGQVEVLRGPQGTLRGRASPSGSITVTTRRPDLSEIGGYVSATGTEKSRWDFNAAINVPLIADKLAVRVAGFAGQNHGNQITGLNVRTGATDKDVWDRTQSLRASVRADPFDGILVLDFNYETINKDNRQYDQVESFNQVLATAGASPVTIRASDYLGITPTARETNVNYKIYNWQAQLNLLGQRLTYVGSSLKGNIHAFAPQDAAGLYPSINPVVPSPTGYAQITENVTRQTTHEVRLQNEERIFGMVDYVAGYMRQASNSPSFFNNVSGIGSASTIFFVNNLGLNRYRSDLEESVFGNLTLHLMDRLELSGGARQIWFRANSGVQTGTYGADISTYAESPSARRCFGDASIAGCLPVKKATIWSASAKFEITDNAMVYASYGTSWRPGNSVIGFRGAESLAQLNTFLNLPDEKSKSYEIGLKTSWLDNRVRFNISAYQQSFENYAFRVSSPVLAISQITGRTAATAALASAFNFVTPVPAKIKGFEAEMAFAVSDRFNLSATVTFADGKISNGVFPCVDLDNNNVPDTAAPTASALWNHLNSGTTNAQVDTCVGAASPSSASRWSGTVQGEYSLPVSDNADVYLRGLLAWKGYNQGFSLNPFDQVKAYGLLDLFAGVRNEDAGWDVTLFARNVFNIRSVLTRTDSPVVSPLVAGQNLANFGGSGTSISSSNATNYMGITTAPPREVGVTLRYAFGSR